MKIVLISTGRTPQDKDLIKAARIEKIDLSVVSYPFNQTFDPQEEFNKLKDFDLVYWRVGNINLRYSLAKLCLLNKVLFIPRIYGQNPQIAKKSFQIEKLKNLIINIPKTLTCQKATKADFNKLKQDLNLPFISKPVIGAQGSDVYLVKSFSQFKKLFSKKKMGHYLFQKYLPNNGDFRVLVVGPKTIGLYKRVPKEKEFRANIAQGGKGVKVTDEKTINQLSLLGKKVARGLDLEVTGLDFIQSNGDFYFIEANTIPQWQGFKKVTGLNPAPLILKYFVALIARP